MRCESDVLSVEASDSPSSSWSDSHSGRSRLRPEWPRGFDLAGRDRRILRFCGGLLPGFQESLKSRRPQVVKSEAPQAVQSISYRNAWRYQRLRVRETFRKPPASKVLGLIQ